MDETTLMLKVKNGDLDSMSFLFDMYSKRLFGYFVRLTHDKQTSEDLTQTVFYRAMKYRTSFKKEHGFNAWVFQIARNVFHDHYQKQQKHLLVMQEESGSDVPDNLQDTTEQRENEERLRKAIGMLEQEEQQLIELHRFQKLKYEEVAQITGSTTAAVKMKTHRTMKRLKNFFFQAKIVCFFLILLNVEIF